MKTTNELKAEIKHLYLQEESALFNLNYKEARLCREEYLKLETQLKNAETFHSHCEVLELASMNNE